MVQFHRSLSSFLGSGKTLDKSVSTCDFTIDKAHLRHVKRSGISNFYKFNILLVAPLVLWLIVFQFAQMIPQDYKPEIDVITLPIMEAALFGKITDRVLSAPLNDFLVLLAALPYLLHFVLPWVFVGYLYLSKREAPLRFLWVIGFLNIAAVLTHVFFPTAPPWYLDKFGSKPASYDIKGDPGRLKYADNVLQFSLFEDLYGNSPIVFGSFPSLHAAWPFLIAAYFSHIRYEETGGGNRWKFSLGFFTRWGYVLWVWWAAIYLKHHYLVDLAGGALYCMLTLGFSKIFLSFIWPRFSTIHQHSASAPRMDLNQHKSNLVSVV